MNVGHAHDAVARTGATVILPDAPVVMGVAVRGGAPGTRETDALAPDTLVERVHALVLSGGSVFGLAAADAVAVALSRRGSGLDAGPLRVPVVPAAILFDLANGGNKGWDEPPYRALALAALAAVGNDTSGALGAGYGATAGSRAGGIGSTGTRAPSGYTVGALVAVNSFGEVYAGEPPSGDVPLPKRDRARGLAGASAGRENTCIGAVATDAPLTRAQATRVAAMAHAGLTRCIRPVHSMFDGDCLFALSTAAEGSAPIDPVELTILGTLAADMVVRAVRRAVFGWTPGND